MQRPEECGWVGRSDRKKKCPRARKENKLSDITEDLGIIESMPLPPEIDRKYKSPALKKLIGDIGMWLMIPIVNYPMDSSQGIRRLRQNHRLFNFIDKYLENDSDSVPYAFEPNMQDGRFVLIPKNSDHQGVGICVSEVSGYLEIGNFWYPGEYTERSAVSKRYDQIYVAMFSVQVSAMGEKLAEMTKKVFDPSGKDRKQCDFVFDLDCVVTLKGNFMDRVEESKSIIREKLKKETPQVQRNGEGLILFMERASRL